MIDVKVTNESMIQEKRFPRLMRTINDPDVIVYFEGYGEGFALSDDHKGRRYSGDWDMSCFADYTGTIELRNA